MRLLAGLVKWNILAQLALPGVYVWQTALLTAFYLRHRHREAYFLFCIASTVARGWSGWTGLMAVCGFQCLGRTVGRAVVPVVSLSMVQRLLWLLPTPYSAGQILSLPGRVSPQAGSTDAGIWRSCWRPHLTQPASTGALVCLPTGSLSCPMLASAAVGWCGARILHNITIPLYLRQQAPQARPAVEVRLYQLPS